MGQNVEKKCAEITRTTVEDSHRSCATAILSISLATPQTLQWLQKKVSHLVPMKVSPKWVLLGTGSQSLLEGTKLSKVIITSQEWEEGFG